MKKFILLSIIILLSNMSLLIAQYNKQELSLPFSDKSFKGLFYKDGIGYALFEDEMFKTNNYGNSFEKINTPTLVNQEYYEEIIQNNSNIYLQTTNSFYKFNDVSFEFTKIFLPFELEPYSKCNGRDPWYDFFNVSGQLFLRVIFYHCDNVFYFFNKSTDSFEKVKYDNKLNYSEFDENFSIINKNSYYKLTKFIPKIYSMEELADKYYKLGYETDSIFFTSNAGEKWRFIKSFTTEKSQTKTNMAFYDIKHGYFYSIGDQFYELHASSISLHSTKNSNINLYMTKDGGNIWTKAYGVDYNDIYEIKFLDENYGIMVCSNVIKEGKYKKSEKGYNYLIDLNNYPAYSYYILNTTDGGLNWKKVLNISPDYANSDFCLSNYKILYQNKSLWLLSGGVFSELGHNWNKIYNSKNNGNDWIEVDSLNNDSGLALYPSLENTVFVRVGGKLLRYTDDNMVVDNAYLNNEQNKYQKYNDCKERIKSANEYFDNELYFSALEQFEYIFTNSCDSILKINLYYEAAYCCYELKRYDEGISYLNKFLKDNPYSDEAFNLIGCIYQRTGDNELALGNYQKAFQININNKDAKNNYDKLQKDIEKKEKQVNDNIVYQYYKQANYLYLELTFASQNNVFNIDFNKVNLAKRLAEEGLKYNSSYSFALNSILSLMNALLISKEFHPEWYK